MVVTMSSVWVWLNPVLQAVLLALLTAVISVATAIAWKRWPKQLEALGLQSDLATNQLLERGAGRLAAPLLLDLLKSGIEPSTVTIAHPLVAAAVSTLIARFPAITANLTPDRVAGFVTGELAKLVVANALPSVPAAAVPAPVTVPIGAPAT